MNVENNVVAIKDKLLAVVNKFLPDFTDMHGELAVSYRSNRSGLHFPYKFLVRQLFVATQMI
jgi:hypothetical protein